MADNTLSFETRVDLSGLNTGTAAATATINKFGGDVKTAMVAAQTATKQLADAQIQLGASAAQGSAAAQAVIAEYQGALDEANAAVARLSATEEAETSVVRSSISTRMAATAELRVFEGNLTGSTRAAGALLSIIPGLGQAMQVAFPVFGAIALVEILGQMAEKIHKVADEFLNARIAEKAFADAVIADGQLEVAASEKFLAARRQQDVVNAELHGGKAGRANRGQAAGAQFDIAQDQNAIIEAARNIQTLHDREQELLKVINGSYSIWTHSAAQIAAHNSEVKNAQFAYDSLISHATAFTAEYNAADAKLTADQEQEHLRRIEAGEKEEGATNRATAQILKAIESRYSEMNAAESQIKGHGLTAGEGAAFWSQYLTTFEAGSDEARRVLEEFTKYQSEIHKDLFSGVVAVNPAAAKTLASSTQEYDQALKALNREYDEEAKATEDVNRGLEGNRKMMEGVAESALMASAEVAKLNAEQENQQNLGKIETAHANATNTNELSLVPNKSDELNELRTFHQEALAEDERYTQAQLAEAQSEAAREEQIYAGNADKIREIQQRLNQQIIQLDKKLEQDRRKGDLEWLNDTKKISAQVAQTEQQSLNKMETDIAKVFATAITTTESWAQASARLFDQVANQFITNLVKMGEQEIVAALLHKDLMKQGVIHDAYKAGADAFTWATAWGGPVAGAIAAAAAFAGVLAFDSFEQGGIVNGSHGMPVPIMAHAGERVLSAPQTQRFESLVNSKQGGNQSSVHLNYNPSISAYDKTGVSKMLRDHMGDIHDIVRQGLKSGALSR